jgi:hypothetical protein
MESAEYQNQLLENIALSLKELLALSRVALKPRVKEVLEKILDSTEKRKVYNLMDGEKTVAAIQEQTGVNVRFISEWGQEWEKLGLVETDTKSTIRGRRKHLFDLSLYDISIEDKASENKSE